MFLPVRRVLDSVPACMYVDCCHNSPLQYWTISVDVIPNYIFVPIKRETRLFWDDFFYFRSFAFFLFIRLTKNNSIIFNRLQNTVIMPMSFTTVGAVSVKDLVRELLLRGSESKSILTHWRQNTWFTLRHGGSRSVAQT